MAKKIDKNEITKEMVQKAMQCKTADELLELAEAEGYEMTKEEAEAYIAELADFELDDATLKKAAGGGCGHCYGACDPDCVENWMPL